MEAGTGGEGVRLIDADALLENQPKDCCRTSDWINDAPTIDAIPVEWLDDRANDITRAPLYRRYAQMLMDEWQKEQEAR